ncbi:hypothetical protein QUB47_24320 [Microcoleus sp. AT9_B5]
MTIAILNKCAYNRLNISFSGEICSWFFPVLSSSDWGLFAGMPLGSDRNWPPQLSLCSDILSVNPDRTCGHLIPGFEEKY